MIVANILMVKGADVVTAQPHRTVAETLRVLAAKGIGAIVVTGARQEVLGIISERDIVRAFAKDGAAALEHPVSRYMTAKVVTTGESATVHEVMEAMTAGRFRHMPVVRDGALTGIISIGDVVKNRLAEIETEHQALRDYIATA